MSYSIKAVNNIGDPLSGKEVQVMYHGIIGSWDTAFTNDDGWAEFNVEWGKTYVITDIYVSGDRVDGDHSVSDGYTLSVTVDY